jgi:ADP-ribose pyrophosphatase YjhB (NUDIX family)
MDAPRAGARAELAVEKLVGWADRLQALARTGLFFAPTDYDRERYQEMIAIAAEMTGLLAGREPLELQTLWSGDMGYVTPRVGVGAIIFDERGDMLLLQRPESGLWGMPVGFSEVGETPAQGLAREVREETTLEVRVDRLLGVYDCRGPTMLHHLYNVVFCCTVLGGTLTPTAEAPVGGYFSRDAMPELVPHHAPSIMDGFAAHHDGWAGAAFDR